MQKITPFLWFDTQAEEAVKFYVSVFTAAGRRDCKIGSVARYSDEAAAGSGRPKGSVMTVTFQLDGQDFMALNGGPVYKFTEAISLMVNCETQKEIDTLWEKLSEGGEKVECGWLKDKYGLAWQIVPAVLPKLMSDPAKAKRVMAALLTMKKLDIRQLQQAADQQ